LPARLLSMSSPMPSPVPCNGKAAVAVAINDDDDDDEDSEGDGNANGCAWFGNAASIGIDMGASLGIIGSDEEDEACECECDADGAIDAWRSACVANTESPAPWSLPVPLSMKLTLLVAASVPGCAA
jgi:hypothetical protein